MDHKKLMGYESPSDKKVRIQVGHWEAQRLALWRSRVAWQIAEKAATEILDRCEHAEHCVALADETKPCAPECPDRETWMSALVILNAARQFGPVNAKKPANAPYYAPSREHFSEVLGELAAAQAELETLRGTVVTVPPPNEETPT
jgi:hypothetical protein